LPSEVPKDFFDTIRNMAFGGKGRDKQVGPRQKENKKRIRRKEKEKT
jgi:hypothetical protein